MPMKKCVCHRNSPLYMTGGVVLPVSDSGNFTSCFAIGLVQKASANSLLRPLTSCPKTFSLNFVLSILPCDSAIKHVATIVKSANMSRESRDSHTII